MLLQYFAVILDPSSNSHARAQSCKNLKRCAAEHVVTEVIQMEHEELIINLPRKLNPLLANSFLSKVCFSFGSGFRESVQIVLVTFRCAWHSSVVEQKKKKNRQNERDKDLLSSVLSRLVAVSQLPLRSHLFVGLLLTDEVRALQLNPTATALPSPPLTGFTTSCVARSAALPDLAVWRFECVTLRMKT